MHMAECMSLYQQHELLCQAQPLFQLPGPLALSNWRNRIRRVLHRPDCTPSLAVSHDRDALTASGTAVSRLGKVLATSDRELHLKHSYNTHLDCWH